MIETTEGTERVEWYPEGPQSPNRVAITFPDSKRETSENIIDMILSNGGASVAMLEMFTDSEEGNYGIMQVANPEALMELATAMEVAALQWNHCIEGCSCFTENTDEEESSETEDFTEKEAAAKLEELGFDVGEAPFDVVEIPGGIAIGLGTVHLADLFAPPKPSEDNEDEASEEDAPSEEV